MLYAVLLARNVFSASAYTSGLYRAALLSRFGLPKTSAWCARSAAATLPSPLFTFAAIVAAAWRILSAPSDPKQFALWLKLSSTEEGSTPSSLHRSLTTALTIKSRFRELLFRRAVNFIGDLACSFLAWYCMLLFSPAHASQQFE